MAAKGAKKIAKSAGKAGASTLTERQQKWFASVQASLERDTGKTLEEWVKSGGQLFATAGAFHFDPYRQPLADGLAFLGLKSAKLDGNTTFFRPQIELPRLAPIDHIGEMPLFGVVDRVDVLPDAKVVASFKRGSPAVVERTLGKGKITYIAALQPKIAFIFDIRRDMMIEHLMYKSIFELSADRVQFVSKLFSRRVPAQLTDAASVQSIFQAYSRAPVDGALAQEHIGQILARLKTHHGFALNAADEAIPLARHFLPAGFFWPMPRMRPAEVMAALNGHGRADRGVRLVAHELEILVAVLEQRRRSAQDRQSRQGVRRA